MSTTGHENEVVRVSGLKASLRKGGNLGIPNKAACSTAAATAAKTITLKEGFALEDGAMVLVTFANAITVANATLAVTYTDTAGTQQTTTAYPIKYRGAALAANLVDAGSVLILRLVYDSTTPANSYWNVVGTLDTDTNTVTDVSFNSATGKLQQTKDGQTSDITTIVTSGFSLTEDDTNGLDIIAPIGSATITDDNENGLDVMTF